MSKKFYLSVSAVLALSMIYGCSGGSSPTNDMATANATENAPDDSPETTAVNIGEAMPVSLSNATATFSQSSFGGFLAEYVIDEDISTQWAIFPNIAPQTLVLETIENTPVYENGTRLTFGLEFDYPTEHLLGCFSLAATDADRSAFANGHNGADGSPGDVGDVSIWTALAIESVDTSNGAGTTLSVDEQIIVDDLDSTVATYTVVAETTLIEITGIRLDVCQDPSLPFNGPGLQNSNGNFHLAEINLSVTALQ